MFRTDHIFINEEQRLLILAAVGKAISDPKVTKAQLERYVKLLNSLKPTKGMHQNERETNSI